MASGLALAVAFGSVSTGAAHAVPAPVSTLYVNNAANSNCSDSGSGTEAIPYCTVQAAAAVVDPGQTVQIEPGHYTGQVTLTRSGTAAEPIKFIGSVDAGSQISDFSIGNSVGTAGSSPPALGLEVDGANYVTVSGLIIVDGTSGTVALVDSTDVELSSDLLYSPGGNSAPPVDLSGSSSSDTIARDEIEADRSGAVGIEPGVSGTVISENIVWANTGTAFSVDSAPGTDITANTVQDTLAASNAAIVLSNGSTGSSVENNIVTGRGSMFGGVSVDAASAADTILDYNIVYPTSGVSAGLYSWAGTDYATAAALDAAVGQGAHDLNTNPSLSTTGLPAEGSPAINSADANAPGEYAIDFYGNPRANDPADADTGTGPGYYDRGAVQRQDPIAISVAPSIQWGGSTLTTTLNVVQTAAAWSSTITYLFAFGDGTSTTTTAASATHKYIGPGSYTVTVTATDADHGVATATTSVLVANGNGYHPLPPTRVLDTRNGTGTNGVVARLAAGKSLSLKIAGLNSVPSTGVAAVVLNLTATDETGSGFLTAFPGGTSVPNTSNLNYTHGVNVPNLVTVELGADGTVDLFNGGSEAGPIDVVADLEGYYAPGPGDGYGPMFPTRLADTRTGNDGPAAGQVYPLYIPTGNVQGYTAAVLNVTVTNAHGAGYISVYPDGSAIPTASNVNYAAGQTVPNLVVVPIGADGLVDLYNGGATAGRVDLVVDLYGLYTDTADGSGFTPVHPTRLIDTRTGLGNGAPGPIAAGSIIQQRSSNFTAVPGNADAVAMNVTVTNTQADGVISVFPGDSVVVTTSNLNYTPGHTIANAVTTEWYPGIYEDFVNSSTGSTDLIADLYGYFA
jgi:hypothetical protein